MGELRELQSSYWTYTWKWHLDIFLVNHQIYF
jgi:hypothetical protein